MVCSMREQRDGTRGASALSPSDRWPALPPWLAGTLVWAVGATWYFRDAFVSGFDTITGDRGDARLVIYLHEHWWRVWHGDAAWRSPDIFAPIRGTLGYADTFALHQIVYVPLRLIGLDQFVAFQLTLVALTAVGFASLFTLLLRYLHLPLAPTCLLATAGVFANNVYVDTGHPQLYSVNVVALVVLVFVASWCATSTRRRVVGSAAGGLLVGLLTWSTFYLGWFTVCFGAGGLVVALLIATATDGVSAVVDGVRSRIATLAAAVAGLAVGAVPFAATYLPVLGDSEPRTYDEVANLAPRPLDLLNVGRHNVLWGRVVGPLLGGDERLDLLHRAVAPTPILLITAGVATYGLLRSARREPVRTGLVTAGLAICATTWVALLLPIQFPIGGLWAWVHRFVPGGDALRVYARAEVIASLLAVLAVSCWLSARSRAQEPAIAGRRSRTEVVLLAVLAVIVVEQANTARAFRRFDRSDELVVLAKASNPPDGCESFYVTDVDRVQTDHSLITAMLVAHRVDRPTLNGYSGQKPPGWDLAPWLDDYDTEVADWIATHGLVGVCSLELTTLEWTQPP